MAVVVGRNSVENREQKPEGMCIGKVIELHCRPAILVSRGRCQSLRPLAAVPHQAHFDLAEISVGDRLFIAYNAQFRKQRR